MLRANAFTDFSFMLRIFLVNDFATVAKSYDSLKGQALSNKDIYT